MLTITLYDKKKQDKYGIYLAETLAENCGKEGLSCSFATNNKALSFILGYSKENKFVCITPEDRVKEMQEFWNNQPGKEVDIITYEQMKEHKGNEVEFLKEVARAWEPLSPEAANESRLLNRGSRR